MRTIYKPWGKEEWLELNDKYCYKRIYINAGYRTSFQYHLEKRETNYIISGIAEIWLENDEGVIEKKTMKGGEYFNVTPPKKHRVIALTDIILQEVSTPEVDDVIRIEDDACRQDGVIVGESRVPAILILAAGLGTRLKSHSKFKNKAMIPINNKAIISHIIDKFPKNYEIIVAVGYKKESLIEYCNLAHNDRKIKFVDVNGWENGAVGPGHSTLQCKSHLQRPFYIITADCLVDSAIPHIDGNWIGTHPTSYTEKYSTVEVDGKNNILNFANKSKSGFDRAFIGLAAILDYEVFWKELENNMNDTELVSAWKNPKNYPTLKIKELNWVDTGNMDDLEKAKEHFNDVPLSLYKDTDEITYKVGTRFLKFNPNEVITSNRYKRGIILSNLVPSNLKSDKNFISYDWEEGMTLYNYNSLSIYESFLSTLSEIIHNSTKWNDADAIKKFYVNKTNERKSLFINKYGNEYYTTGYKINGIQYDSMKNILEKVDFSSLVSNPLYSHFHGDLQFDNIIYNNDNKKFTYIDWRESFAELTSGGDLYYDLSKLYGGCLLSYNTLKNNANMSLVEGPTSIYYDYTSNEQLDKFRESYESWLIQNDFDLLKIKLITGLIYLNMSPLHTDTFNKILWAKSVEILHNAVYK